MEMGRMGRVMDAYQMFQHSQGSANGQLSVAISDLEARLDSFLTDEWVPFQATIRDTLSLCLDVGLAYRTSRSSLADGPSARVLWAAKDRLRPTGRSPSPSSSEGGSSHLPTPISPQQPNSGPSVFSIPQHTAESCYLPVEYLASSAFQEVQAIRQAIRQEGSEVYPEGSLQGPSLPGQQLLAEVATGPRCLCGTTRLSGGVGELGGGGAP